MFVSAGEVQMGDTGQNMEIAVRILIAEHSRLGNADDAVVQ